MTTLNEYIINRVLSVVESTDKSSLASELATINSQLKLMRGGPVGEPNSVAFVDKRAALTKRKEEIIAQLRLK